MEAEQEVNSASSASPSIPSRTQASAKAKTKPLTPNQKTQPHSANPSPSQSPAASPSYNLNSRFNIPVLPEYHGGQNPPDDGSIASAVLLGIQELERQQEQLELKRQRQVQNIQRENPFEITAHANANVANHRHNTVSWSGPGKYNRPQDHSGVPMTVHVTGDADDELTTESEMRDVQPVSSGKRHSRINSIGKLLKTPLKPIRRTISDKFNVDPTPTRNPSEQRMNPIIFGSLHKLGRNNKWQKRWFESYGKELKYFKSKKKEKCLATLDLLRVGSILMDFSDTSGCTFTIEVAERQYYLCADTKERAQDWVITLNRAKEARAQVGGLKLIDPNFGYEGKRQLQLRSRSGSDSDDENIVTTRVVMNAARPRTKGLGKEEFSVMEKSMEEEERNIDGHFMTTNTATSPSAGSRSITSSSPRHPFQNARLNQLSLLHMNAQNDVAVRWTKQRSAVQNWGRRLSRWTKRMTMVRCVIKDDIVHLNNMIHHHQRALVAEDLHDDSEEDDTEEPFIDLDIARYSHCQESYIDRDAQRSYDFGDNSANSLQPSTSWRVQTSDLVASTGSSIQSSTGRISPILADDDSRIIA